MFGDDLEVTAPKSMAIDEEDHRYGRILAGSHGDILILDEDNLSEDKVKKEILC